MNAFMLGSGTIYRLEIWTEPSGLFGRASSRSWPMNHWIRSRAIDPMSSSGCGMCISDLADCRTCDTEILSNDMT